MCRVIISLQKASNNLFEITFNIILNGITKVGFEVNEQITNTLKKQAYPLTKRLDKDHSGHIRVKGLFGQ